LYTDTDRLLADSTTYMGTSSNAAPRPVSVAVVAVVACLVDSVGSSPMLGVETGFSSG
jgi:hypothetical protein